MSVSYESVDKRRSATLVEGKPVNAGDYKATVTVGTGEDAVSASVEYTIQKKEISVYSIDASDKIYDGATKVKVSRVTLIGILEQDVVEADTTDLYGDLPDKNAGTYTEITLPKLKLVGDSADNYELIQPDNPLELIARVTIQKAQKAPNMPEASIEVDYTKTTVGAVTLPAGWKFDDTKLDTALEIDKTVTVTAKYAGEDAGNYEVESVEITLTRKACTHPTTKWIVDKEATVDAEGSRHKECTVCNTVLATETIAKLKAQTPDVTIRYTTHVQTYGWQGDENNANKWFANGKMAGTSGKAKRLEGIKIRVYGNDNLGIQYTTHCQSYGWLCEASGGCPDRCSEEWFSCTGCKLRRCECSFRCTPVGKLPCKEWFVSGGWRAGNVQYEPKCRRRSECKYCIPHTCTVLWLARLEVQWRDEWNKR